MRNEDHHDHGGPSGPGPPPLPGHGLFPAYLEALRLDAMAARLARSHGAIDLALGETLHALFETGRLMQLDFASRVDYIRERVGLPRRTVFQWLELAGALATRPLLRRAVVAGAVSPRKALAVLPLAHGDDEAAWTAAAMTMRVRDLEKAVRAEGKEPPGPYDVESLYLSMTAEQQDRLDVGITMAQETLGYGAPRWQCVEAIAIEWMSGFPDWLPPEDGGARGTEDRAGARGTERPADMGAGAGARRHSHSPRRPPPPAPKLSKAERRRQTRAVARQLAAIEEANAVAEDPRFGADPGIDGRRGLGDAAGHEALEGMKALDEACPRGDVLALDARVQRLLLARRRFDEVLGIVLLRVVQSSAWVPLGYGTFECYCRERLLMSARTVRQRVWLERQMCALPPLRQALARGDLTYSKALLVAGDATLSDIDEKIARAAKTTCQQTERETTAREDKRNRDAGVRRLWGPRDAMGTTAAGVACAQAWCRAVCAHEIDAGEALALMADYFVRVWELHRPDSPGRAEMDRTKVLLRHGGLCAAPMCSRPARHRHHIQYRSRGGSDEVYNLLGLCEVHHNCGIHKGRLTVVGRAGEWLRWVFATGEVWITEGDDDVRREETP